MQQGRILCALALMMGAPAAAGCKTSAPGGSVSMRVEVSSGLWLRKSCISVFVPGSGTVTVCS